jgi:diacylglycerol kinase (ATP)
MQNKSSVDTACVRSAKADLILVNPAAGGGHAMNALPALQTYATRTGWDVAFQVASSASDLSRRAQAAAAAEQECILILGGDGSFQVLANALINFPRVVLGILPAGCGNDLAKALGLPQDPVRAAKLLRNADVVAIDAAKVKTSDGKTRLFTGGGGVGLDAEASRIAATHYRGLSGRFRYLFSAARAYSGCKPIRLHVRMELSDGSQETLTSKLLLLGVLNTPSYGAGLRFAPEAKISDGILDLVFVEDLPLLEILQALPRLVFQGEVRSRRVRRFSVRKVIIEADRPCCIHGDGEIFGFTPAEVEIVPQAFRVLRPRKQLSEP